MRAIILFLTALLLQGCENAPVRREETLHMHPEWSSEHAQLVRAGYLAKGMNQDQVRAAWGRPCWSCVGTTKGDWGEAWEYATQVVFFDKDGKVTRWEAK